MKRIDALPVINELFNALEKLIPQYMQDPADGNISNGNVAVCIIEENGRVHGRMFGANKPRVRKSYHVAWTKASQVWLTAAANHMEWSTSLGRF